jgi:hypothetical protein
VGSSRPSPDHPIQTQAGDTISGEYTSLLLRPYSRQSQQYSRVSPTQYRGTHHPCQPTWGPWDESPHAQDSDPFLWSSGRTDGVSQGGYRTGRLGAPFHPQGLDPTHASLGEIVSKSKWISSQVISLARADDGHTESIQQILKRLETIETHLSALEEGAANVSGIRERKRGGTLRGGANSHLSLKVSPRTMLPKMLG